MLPDTIPKQYRREAYKQWARMILAYFVPYLSTIFPMGLIVAFTSKRAESPFGERPTKHRQKYIDAGSSGKWFYEASDVRFVDNWNNFEDGNRGEPSGKHSARCGGKEGKWYNKYLWAVRNPYNKGKRTSEFWSCFVDECELEYWGSREVSDKDLDPSTKGWYFVRAVHRQTGEVYYNYRSVRNHEDGENVRQMQIGFKLKPTHAGQVQDADDKDKAFTVRAQFRSKPD